jgi:EpsI family protein
MDQPYDQVLMRSYGRSDGTIVMLALAYGRNQRQEVKIHRPELCYVAQGFEVVDRKIGTLRLSDTRGIEAYRIVARGRDRVEPVTYWIRIGDRVVRNAWDSRMKILRDGLKGTVPDGLLVRASSLTRSTGDIPAAHEIQEQFLGDLYRALDEGSRAKLTGS